MPRENKTKYAVLGLLAYAPMSGYDVKRIYAQSLGNFWSESYGHIYPILKRLEDEGLATRSVEHQDGKPDRNVYTITELGREELHRWLAQPLDPHKERVELLLKLFHGWEVGPAVMIEHVKRTRAEHEALLQEVRPLRRGDGARDRAAGAVLAHDRELRAPHQRGLHRLVRRDAGEAGATPEGTAGRSRTVAPGRARAPGGRRMTTTTSGTALVFDGRAGDEPTLCPDPRRAGRRPGRRRLGRRRLASSRGEARLVHGLLRLLGQDARRVRCTTTPGARSPRAPRAATSSST